MIPPHAGVTQKHADRITHTEQLPARSAVVEPWPEQIPESVREAFPETAGALWAHQAEALNELAAGRHVVLATGTSSGKSLVFQAAGLAAIRAGRSGQALDGHRRPTVLYIAPTKALAADQWRRLAPLDVAAAAVDGDNSREDREWARNHAAWILTNPDTLHHVLLPGHERWGRVLGGLRYVVVDEAHHYRGVFGAHVALILRRLRRICATYGSNPQFVLASATMSDPAGVAGRLTGLEVAAVCDDASPRAARRVVLWQPPLIRDAPPEGDGVPTGGAPTEVRRSVTAEAADLLTDLVVAGTRTLVFVRSRRGAELVAGATQRLLAEVDPALPTRVATYRGGYLPEERRELEARLRSGDLLGLATTNALELGIDISGLDAVVSVGFPGTRAALEQQFGRAGRVDPSRAATRPEALGVFMARDEPLDAYLVNHPEALLDAPLETTVFDTDNPYVLGPHLAAAAHERPLTEADAAIFGPRTMEGIAALEQAGWLRKRAAGWFWTRRDRASDLADLRSSGGRPVQIVDSATGRLIGTVDASSADATVHDGAVYVHQGESWVCDRYDVEAGVAEMHPESPEYWTQARSTTEIAIVETAETQDWGGATISHGTVDVSSQVVGYTLRDRNGRSLGDEPLILPERTLRTSAVWWTVPASALEGVVAPADVPGAAHAAEHASIGMLPLLATCDRWDLGGVSTALHPDTGRLTVFVHDAYAGGAGFAEHGYRVAAHWLMITRDLVAGCACISGCPSCIQSPKCGNGNEPLDKSGAVRLFDLLLEHASSTA
ncbi:MAG TPA: DEAD/DEAH box helicase [Aeromicrobium sp.]|nr:DEAD/DEAH box helicase [Aeromicrobium sp.]HKY59056.1 DEAD/DEAH box helicase [Aeromicrobium sp.]